MSKARKYYIAYGSNLSVRAMTEMCPDAKVAGMSYLKDWRMVFKYHADIEPFKGRVVPVLIWEISERDEKNLDAYESYPRYYVKREFDLTMTDLGGNNPEQITAFAYIMVEGRPVRSPADSYYRILEEGYRRFGFNTYLLELALDEALESEAPDEEAGRYGL